MCQDTSTLAFHTDTKYLLFSLEHLVSSEKCDPKNGPLIVEGSNRSAFPKASDTLKNMYDNYDSFSAALGQFWPHGPTHGKTDKT